MIYRFGSFELDGRTGELRSGARSIPLQEKPRRLLQALLERPGELVTREELRERLWAGAHVDFDRGLGNALLKLREALGDSAARPRVVETLPRRGFRFLLPVSRVVEARGPRSSRPGSFVPSLGTAAAVLLLSLTLAWSRSLPEPSPRDGEAWEALERGRYFSAQKTPEGLERAVVHLREALERDPGLAPAWAALAEAHHFRGAMGVLSPAEAYRLASTAARRALRLDGSLAEAHAVLAETNFRFGPDDAEAEREFRRALELGPGSATIRHWRANYLAHKGRLAEGLREMEEALRIAPLSLHIAVDLAGLLYDSGRVDEAYRRLHLTLQLDDRFPKTHLLLGHLYRQEKRYDRAIAAFVRASELAPDTPKFLAPLAVVYAEAGRVGEAEQTLARIRALRDRRHVPADLIAEVERHLRGGRS